MTTWSRDLHLTSIVSWRSSFGPQFATLCSLCVWECMKMTISGKKKWGKTMLTLIFFRPFYAKKLPMMGDFRWCWNFFKFFQEIHLNSFWGRKVSLNPATCDIYNWEGRLMKNCSRNSKRKRRKWPAIMSPCCCEACPVLQLFNEQPTN
jgi:hypothetical protein